MLIINQSTMQLLIKMILSWKLEPRQRINKIVCVKLDFVLIYLKKIIRSRIVSKVKVISKKMEKMELKINKKHRKIDLLKICIKK